MSPEMIERKKLYGKKGKTRRAILHAAKVLLEESSWEHMTIATIAKAADVSRTTIFNHFGTVQGLLTALCAEEVDEVVRYCREQERETGPDVVHVFDILLQDAAIYPSLFLRLIGMAVLTQGEQNPVVRIEEMVKERMDGDEEAVLMLTGAFYALLNHNYARSIPYDVKEMQEQMRRVIAGVKADRMRAAAENE